MSVESNDILIDILTDVIMRGFEKAFYQSNKFYHTNNVIKFRQTLVVVFDETQEMFSTVFHFLNIFRNPIILN